MKAATAGLRAPALAGSCSYTEQELVLESDFSEELKSPLWGQNSNIREPGSGVEEFSAAKGLLGVKNLVAHLGTFLLVKGSEASDLLCT